LAKQSKMEAKIWNHSEWIGLTDKQKLKDTFTKMLIDAEFTILDYIEYDFKPQGYTGLWLLAESHFAIHTFPEEKKSYIELSSCNELKNDSFMELLKTVRHESTG